MLAHVFVFPGSGPVLGRGPRGVGQSGAAATQDEAAGGMSEDLSGTVFCCKRNTPHGLQLQMKCDGSSEPVWMLSLRVHTLHNNTKIC